MTPVKYRTIKTIRISDVIHSFSVENTEYANYFLYLNV